MQILLKTAENGLCAFLSSCVAEQNDSESRAGPDKTIIATSVYNILTEQPACLTYFPTFAKSGGTGRKKDSSHSYRANTSAIWTNTCTMSIQ